MRIFSRPGRLITTAVAAAAAALLVPALPAGAASITYTAPTWSLSQTGTILTVETSFTASSPIMGDKVGVCARNSSNGLVDFPFTDSVPLSTNPADITAARALSPGNYTIWPCVKAGGYWHDVGTKYPVVVINPATTPTYPAAVPNPTPSTPSGQAMPVGDLPGWRQIFSDDFTTPLAQGSFPGSYAGKWQSYNGFKDSSGRGMYNQNIISVHDGAMDMNLKTVNGVPQGAAPSPITTGGWKGQTYGRYTMRFRSDWLPGFGAGWLLWPDSGTWDDGEIDFPEGGLGGTMGAFNHCVGNASNNCTAVNTGVTFIDWHTTTIEWSPAGVVFILDGKVVGTDTRSIPAKALHWVLQTGTSGALPAAGLNGHVLIDWVSVYAYVPPAAPTTTTPAAPTTSAATTTPATTTAATTAPATTAPATTTAATTTQATTSAAATTSATAAAGAPATTISILATSSSAQAAVK